MKKKLSFAIKSGQEDVYAAYVKLNSNDDYSRAGVEIGEAWAKLLQNRIPKDATSTEVLEILKQFAWKDFGTADKFGCSGFLYGCIVNALVTSWLYGEELCRWHNKKWGGAEESKSVINPAIIMVEVK